MVTIKVAETEQGARWLTEGFEYFRRDPGIWVVMAVIFLLFFIVLSLVKGLGGLVMTLLTPVLVGGVILGCRDLDQGKRLTVSHLFAGFSKNTGQLILLGLFHYIGMVIIMIISLLIVTPFMGGMPFFMQFIHTMEGGNMDVAASMYLGMLLVVLVGMLFYVPVIMALWFAPVLVVLDDESAVNALINSFKGCLQNIVPFLIYGLLGTALAIVASIPFFLGWLVLTPMILASIYLGYKDIFVTSPVDTLAHDAT